MWFACGGYSKKASCFSATYKGDQRATNREGISDPANEIIAIVIITGRIKLGSLEQERKKLNRGLNCRIPSLLHCFALAGYGTEHRGVAETFLCLYIVFFSGYCSFSCQSFSVPLLRLQFL